MKQSGKRLCVAGVNHSTTPIGIREKLAISVSQIGDAPAWLHSRGSHGMVLSTCNRTEVYLVAGDDHSARQAGIDFLAARTDLSGEGLLPHIYVHHEREAMEHLFRVASGLDSMIIGEFEILGQVKQAMEEAEKTGLVGLPLLNLFRQAVRVGRRVREETDISRNALSVSSVAVELAKKVVGDISRRRVLVIGAGEAGRLVAKAARDRGARNMAVTSRSHEKAAILAATLGGEAVDLSNLREELRIADIVVSCTGAPHLILDSYMLQEVMRARPDVPLVLIDIAVPRDVEPGAEKIRNVFLYNIDHLNEIAESNRQLREEEVQCAMVIIEAEVDRFASWWRTLGVRHTVSALVKKAEDIRQKELDRTLKKLRGLSGEERDMLESMTKALTQKLLHEPIQCLKEKEGYSEVVSELFRLEQSDPDEEIPDSFPGQPSLHDSDEVLAPHQRAFSSGDAQGAEPLGWGFGGVPQLPRQGGWVAIECVSKRPLHRHLDKSEKAIK